jgi:hypothetical protein
MASSDFSSTHMLGVRLVAFALDTVAEAAIQDIRANSSSARHSQK